MDLWNKITGYDDNLPHFIPSMDLYLVKSKQPTSAVIICPGGGYHMKAEHEGYPIAQWINSLGMSAFVLDYRVYPYHHPYPLMDVQRAVRLVRFYSKEWNIDANKIAVLGFSAGGHLASTCGTHFDSGDQQSDDPVERMNSRPDAMVLCYPVITFGEFRHDGSMRALLGEAPDDKLRNQLSNENAVTAETPPTFLWHTADDDAVPVENSMLFASELSRSKVPFEIHVFPKGRHGLGLAKDEPEVSAWTGLCEQWLRGLRFI